MNETRRWGAGVGGQGESRTDIESAAEKAGVDLATIQERLRMTPAERLAANTRGWRLVQLFRLAGSEARAGSTSR